MSVYSLQVKNLEGLQKSRGDLIKRIQSGSAIDVKSALDLMNRKIVQFKNVLLKNQIVLSKFSIQRSIGIVFDNLDVPQNLQKTLKTSIR